MTTLQAQMRSTYRYLRMSMPLLGVVLGTSVVIQIFSTEPRCWLGSISAYYYTPARAVFVAALCAIGAALVVFKGPTAREDIALNVAGVGAFTLALIPTPLKPISADGDFETCSRSNEPSAEQRLQAALENNALTLIIGITLLALVFAICRVALKAGEGRPDNGAVIAPAVLSLVAWVSYVVWHTQEVSVQKVERVGIPSLSQPFRWYLVHHHRPTLAALCCRTRAGSASAVRWDLSKWLPRESGNSFLGALIFVPLWAKDKANGLFWFETSMITAFVVFWTLQTVENWGREQIDPEPSTPVESQNKTLSALTPGRVPIVARAMSGRSTTAASIWAEDTSTSSVKPEAGWGPQR